MKKLLLITTALGLMIGATASAEAAVYIGSPAVVAQPGYGYGYHPAPVYYHHHRFHDWDNWHSRGDWRRDRDDHRDYRR